MKKEGCYLGLIMQNKSSEIKTLIANFENLFYTIRGQRVILDSDLAGLYKISISKLHKLVKKHPKRFPDDFMFQLTDSEFKNLMGEKYITNKRKPLYVFTECGVLCYQGYLIMI
jgi:hypothetical protein